MESTLSDVHGAINDLERAVWEVGKTLDRILKVLEKIDRNTK